MRSPHFLPTEESSSVKADQAVLSRPIQPPWPEQPKSAFLEKRKKREDSLAFSRAPFERAAEPWCGWLGLAHPAQEVSGITISPELGYVASTLRESRKILEFGDDWDGEGSPGYSEQTWKRAAQFLADNALVFYRKRAGRIPLPAIHHGPEGSIDLYWNTAVRRLLVNIPADPNAAGTYHGSDGQSEVKGRLGVPNENLWLMVWLAR